jgi:hypothetical protein
VHLGEKIEGRSGKLKGKGGLGGLLKKSCGRLRLFLKMVVLLSLFPSLSLPVFSFSLSFFLSLGRTRSGMGSVARKSILKIILDEQ